MEHIINTEIFLVLSWNIHEQHNMKVDPSDFSKTKTKKANKMHTMKEVGTIVAFNINNQSL